MRISVVAGLLLLSVPLRAAAQDDPAPDSPQRRLATTARAGDVAEVRKLLDAGVDVNTPLRYGTTALYPACDRGHVEVVRRLLERGAKMELTDTFYVSSPLGWALNPAFSDFNDTHVEVVGLLLDKGASGRDGVLSAGPARGNTRL